MQQERRAADTAVMPGWIMERALKDGTAVFDIGYRADGPPVQAHGRPHPRRGRDRVDPGLADVERHRITQPTTERLKSYAERWLTRRAPFVEPGTLEAYQNDVTYRIVPVLGPRVAARPDRGEDRARDPRHAGASAPARLIDPTYSAKTINNTLATLSVIMGAAVTDGLLPENVARRQAGADRPLRLREPHREMRYLIPAEIPPFLMACDPIYEDLAAAMALAGPYLIGRDLTRSGAPSRFIIDIPDTDAMLAAATAPAAYEHVKTHILPDREDLVRKEALRNKKLLEADPQARVRHRSSRTGQGNRANTRLGRR